MPTDRGGRGVKARKPLFEKRGDIKMQWRNAESADRNTEMGGAVWVRADPGLGPKPYSLEGKRHSSPVKSGLPAQQELSQEQESDGPLKCKERTGIVTDREQGQSDTGAGLLEPSHRQPCLCSAMLEQGLCP